MVSVIRLTEALVRNRSLDINKDARLMTTLPPWADPKLSSEITDIQSAGEGQHIEFKRELDTDDVRREIAAFFYCAVKHCQ